VGADLLAVDINVAILSLCQRPRKLQSWPNKNELHLASSSQSQDLLVQRQWSRPKVHLQKIRMDKVKTQQTMLPQARACVAEEVVMDEAKVWLLASMAVEVLQCGVVVRSNSHPCNLLQMPLQLGRGVTSHVGEAQLEATTETHLGTSKATGGINPMLDKLLSRQINKLQWVTSRPNKVPSNQVTVIGALSISPLTIWEHSNMEANLNWFSFLRDRWPLSNSHFILANN